MSIIAQRHGMTSHVVLSISHLQLSLKVVSSLLQAKPFQTVNEATHTCL
jgi:hypothetical protein